MGPRIVTPNLGEETPILIDMELSSPKKELSCTVTGNPEPKIHWLMNGEKLGEDFYTAVEHVDEFVIKSTLSFPEVRKGTAGNYSCIGQNRLGTKAKQDFLVRVTSLGMS